MMLDNNHSQPYIIGGGITGAWTAYLLAQQGILATIITNNEANMASHINPGGINPLHGPGIPGVMEDFSMQAYQLHLAHWDNIQRLSGINFDGRIIERILLAFNETEKQQLVDNKTLYDTHHGFSAHWLNPAEISAEDTRLTRHAVAGLYTRGNATVDAELYTQAILLAAQALSANVVHDSVTSLSEKSGSYTMACSSGHRFSANCVIVTNGARARDLLQPLGLDVPVKPVKGELLLLEISDKPFAFDITCDKDGLYQYKDNLYWLGGTREDIGFDFSISTASADHMLDNAAMLVPGIRNYPIKGHFAAMRPGTPDGLPIVGRLKPYHNLFIATGGGSKGMLWSASMANTIVKLLVNETDDRACAFISPARFLPN